MFTTTQNKHHKIPVLSENPMVRYTTFILLYFSQGIPEGITIFAIPAWMAMNGKSTAEIAGYSAVIMIPFTLKILLAPVMERYTYLPMGRRKPWLLFGQFGILCSLIGLSFVPNPLENISLLAAVSVCVHIFVMFQDIATDSLVIDVVPIDEQGKANSFMWGSKTIGTSVSLAVGTLLINQIGFQQALVIMSAFVVFILFVALFVKERKGEKLHPWSAGSISPEAASLVVDSWKKMFRSFRQVVLLKNMIFLLLSLFISNIALHYMRTLLPIFTIQELGWTNAMYSTTYSTSNLAGGILGMFIGGYIILRFGVIRLIQGSLFTLVLLILSVVIFPSLWLHPYFVGFLIAVFCTMLTLITIGGLALAMLLCWKRISAMQFTFCMTIFNLGLTTGAALLGLLRENFGWQIIFVVFMVLILSSMFVLQFIKTDKHIEQVGLLENNYLEIVKTEGSLLVQSETN